MHQILLSLVVIICIAILSVFIDRIDVKKRKIILYVLFITGYYVHLSCYRNTWLSHSNTLLFIDTRIVHLVVGRGVFENMVILWVLMLLSCIYRNISNPFNSACVCFPLIYQQFDLLIVYFILFLWLKKKDCWNKMMQRLCLSVFWWLYSHEIF